MARTQESLTCCVPPVTEYFLVTCNGDRLQVTVSSHVTRDKLTGEVF